MARAIEFGGAPFRRLADMSKTCDSACAMAEMTNLERFINDPDMCDAD